MTTLSAAFAAHARVMSTDHGVSSSLTAARARLASRRLERRAFATIICSIWHPEKTSAPAAMTAAGQEPPRQEIDPDERRWQLEWERRNIED